MLIEWVVVSSQQHHHNASTTTTTCDITIKQTIKVAH